MSAFGDIIFWHDCGKQEEEAGVYEEAARSYRICTIIFGEADLPIYDSGIDKMVQEAYDGYDRCLKKMSREARRQFRREDWARNHRPNFLWNWRSYVKSEVKKAYGEEPTDTTQKAV